MKLKIFATLGLFAIAAVTQAAEVSINDITIAPGTPTAHVPINISGGEDISGMNLSFSAGDLADAITILSTGNEFDGTIWDNHAGGFIAAEADPGDTVHSELYAISLLGADLTESADGLIATLWLDTSTLPEGTYELNPNFVDPTSGVGSSAFVVNSTGGLDPINLAFNGGTLTVIPEPSTVVLMGIFGCLGLGVFLKRRRG